MDGAFLNLMPGEFSVTMDDQNLEPEVNMEDVNVDAVSASNDGAGTATDQEGEIDLAEQLTSAETRANEYLESLQRERASFQNYKRRVEREKAEQSRAAAGNVMTKLLPVLDDFYRALNAVPAESRDQWFEGVGLILRKFERFLQDEGVTEIEALGQPFDPNFHEVVGMDQESEAESGTITEVLLRGYLLGDRVLRPAMVKVAS